MSDISCHEAVTKPQAKSRVTNGKDVLPDVDGRSRGARRFRDVLDSLIAEYGATSEGDVQLCRRAAGFSAWLDAEEAKQARGEAVDIDEMVRASNALRRLLRDLAASAKTRRLQLRSAVA